MAPKILPYFPPHTTYVEPFAGGLSVLLNKQPAPIEIASDLDPDLINCLLVVRDQPTALASRLATVTYDKATFEAAKAFLSLPHRKGASEFERAVQFLVLRRFSRGGLDQLCLVQTAPRRPAGDLKAGRRSS